MSQLLDQTSSFCGLKCECSKQSQLSMAPQVYDVANELVEVREEAELLRLQMEVAQQEEEAARSALAAAQAALAAALAGPVEPLEPSAPQVCLMRIRTYSHKPKLRPLTLHGCDAVAEPAPVLGMLLHRLGMPLVKSMWWPGR